MGSPLICHGDVPVELAVDRLQLRNDAAMAKAIRYLVTKGHQRIAFLGASPEDAAMRHRLVGYRQALSEAGVPFREDFILTGEPSSNELMSRLSDLMISTPQREKPTALVAGSDLLAVAAMKTLGRLSLKVPEHVAVIGFGDAPVASLVSPALTTLRQPVVEMARDCTGLMIERLRGLDKSGPQTLYYEPKLVIRDSA